MHDVVELLILLRDRLSSQDERDALAVAINALSNGHRKLTGRRATDPILDLATHPAVHVDVAQLAEYWGRHPITVAGYIRSRLLPARKVGGTYLVRTSDALAFERRDPVWRRQT